MTTIVSMGNLPYLLNKSMDNTVSKWNLATQNQVGCYSRHASDVICIKVSEEYRLMATGFLDNTVRVWYMVVAEKLLY